jgi:8-oxo-dGTP diphosphatase
MDIPKHIVAVDIVVIGVARSGNDKLLLIRRGGEPFKGKLALPGGLVEVDETIEGAAARELKEETNLDVGTLDFRLSKVMSHPKRDPRGRVISVVLFTCVLLDTNEDIVKAGDDASEAIWIEVNALKKNPEIVQELAFDHAYIVTNSVNHFSQYVSANRKP